MRFCTFAADGRTRPGVMPSGDDRIAPLDAPDLLSFLRSADPLGAARAALAEPGARYPLAAVRLLAPIPRPDKNIFCVGLNYRDHNSELAGTFVGSAAHPVIFTKSPTAVVGPDAPIESHPGVTAAVDYEAELAVVIGKGGQNIAVADGYDHVFGYTALNDVTARDLQMQVSQWFLGKSLDTFCPMGPVLVHRDGVEWPVQLTIEGRVNGELRQHSNTRHLLYDIAALIAAISRGHALEPGDIIATGTCAGVGMGFTPPRYLKDGDLVEIEIEGIGTLRNRVVHHG